MIISNRLIKVLKKVIKKDRKMEILTFIAVWKSFRSLTFLCDFLAFFNMDSNEASKFLFYVPISNLEKKLFSFTFFANDKANIGWNGSKKRLKVLFYNCIRSGRLQLSKKSIFFTPYFSYKERVELERCSQYSLSLFFSSLFFLFLRG